MTFKVKVLLYSVDGELWTVDVIKETTSTLNPKNGKPFMFGEFFVKGVLKEGDVLIKRTGRC